MKPLRDRDGRFAGSVASGAAQAPSPAFASQTSFSSAGNESLPADGGASVEGVYSAFRSNQDDHNDLVDTYPTRLAAYRAAEETHRLARQESDALRAEAGGRAIQAGACASCGHTAHERHCTQSIQVMSDLWEQCPCAASIAPTEAQVRAANAVQVTSQRYREMIAAHEEADKLVAGDNIVVARGRKVARGTAGQVIRSWDGDYGLRVLFRNEAGEDVWVAASNIERRD
jgi:hypothetical protein